MFETFQLTRVGVILQTDLSLAAINSRIHCSHQKKLPEFIALVHSHSILRDGEIDIERG